MLWRGREWNCGFQFGGKWIVSESDENLGFRLGKKGNWWIKLDFRILKLLEREWNCRSGSVKIFGQKFYCESALKKCCKTCDP